jgi:ribosomal protein L37AE/L43A
MSVTLAPPSEIDTMPVEEIDPRHRPADGNCPMCGSSSTYQTGGGRWGCTQCGSTWSE